MLTIINIVLGGIIYSSLYNVLCLPAGIVQVTNMSAEDVKNMINYPRGNPVVDSIHMVRYQVDIWQTDVS